MSSSIQRKVDTNNNPIDIYTCSIDTLTTGLENSTGNYVISKGNDLTNPYLTINGNNGNVIISNNLVVKGTTTTSNTTSVNLETTNLSIGLKDEVIMTSMTQVGNTGYTNYYKYANITVDSALQFTNTSNIKLKGISSNNQSIYNITYPSDSVNTKYSNINIIPNNSINFGFTNKLSPIYDVTDSLTNSSFYFKSIFNAHLATKLTSNIDSTDTVIKVDSTNGWDVSGTVLIRNSTVTTTIDSATDVVPSSPVKTIKVKSVLDFNTNDYVAGVNSVGSHFVLGKIDSINLSDNILTFNDYISGSLIIGYNVYKLYNATYTAKTTNTLTLSQSLSNSVTLDSENLQIFNAKSFIGDSNLFYFVPNSSSPSSGSNSLILKISTVQNDQSSNYIPIFDNSPPDITLIGNEFCTLLFDSDLSNTSPAVTFTLKAATIAEIQPNTTNDGLFSLDFNFTDRNNDESTKSICIGSDNISSTHYDSIYFTKMENNTPVTYFELDYANNQVSFKNGATIQNNEANKLILNATSNTNVSSVTQSISTTSGALTVSGGVGIFGNTNIGGTLGVTGASTLNGTL